MLLPLLHRSAAATSQALHKAPAGRVCASTVLSAVYSTLQGCVGPPVHLPISGRADRYRVGAVGR